ncbi:hypothetical protein [Sulfitobacter maritimus]|uniref:hypothetical protein n=1 Tax=Sulfitobacter maritimus TaxID=2741719 RepID=UPI001FE4648D|nr:hypothetical protein [Sulfitobacter maritimus]
MAQIRAALVLDIVVNDTCNTAEDEHPMMNSNKILTVSYGTFSCTLEGFDDSFGTMKAIAEYFRDLASDDRYFGAEPPQPDAEMLARIAQKEVSRRVQAREQEGKIVLSALEDQSAPPSGIAAPHEAQSAPAPQAAAPQPAASEPATPVTTPADTAVLDAQIADTAAVAAEQPKEAPVTVEAPVAQEAPSVEAEAPVAEAPADEADVPAEETPKDKAETTEAEAFFASSPQPQTDYEDEAQSATVEDIPTAPTPPADSIAAKLQRIRAVVAQQDEGEGYDDEDAANTAAPEMVADHSETAQNDAAITAARREIEEALEADEAANAIAEQEASEAEDDDLADILNRLEKGDAPAAADAASEPTRDEAEKPAPRGRVIRVRRAELDAAVSRGDLEEVTEAKPEPAQDNSDTAAKADKSSSSLSPEDEDDLARELAALEAELAGTAPVEPEVEAVTPEIEDTPEVEAEVDEAPTAEDAPDAIEATETEAEEPRVEDVETHTAVEEPAKDAAAQAARRSLPTIDDETSPDMSRLMAETDSKMGEPESATRRDAFAHLRAAVAAKKADEAMGGRATTATSDDAYREDLAEVVRPRRPVSRPARTERPSGDARPAPLKLVAEQRIDVEQLRPTGPVRPRRVAAVVEPSNANPDAESFADFATDMGATKLPELLEAAASYMSFVEGRDQFSRPQLMGKVRSVGLNEFSREDGLRSFGQLLRAGKIEKIKGGRFTVSEDIGYRPDHRAVG